MLTSTGSVACILLERDKDLFVDYVKLSEDLQFSLKGANYDLLVCFLSR